MPQLQFALFVVTLFVDFLDAIIMRLDNNNLLTTKPGLNLDGLTIWGGFLTSDDGS